MELLAYKNFVPFFWPTLHSNRNVQQITCSLKILAVFCTFHSTVCHTSWHASVNTRLSAGTEYSAAHNF